MNTILVVSKFDKSVSYLYQLDYEFSDIELEKIANAITNTVSHEYFINDLSVIPKKSIFISKKQGVTDDKAKSLKIVIDEVFSRRNGVGTKAYPYRFLLEDIFIVDVLGEDGDLSGYNPVIYDIAVGAGSDASHSDGGQTRRPARTANELMDMIDLDVSDEELLGLSRDRVLALDLVEMKAIKEHFSGRLISDCELEILAQSWSEHCKHKEFSALIDYKDLDTGESVKIDGLFDTYIKATTDKVNESLGSDNFLIKVFSDNSGVVKIDDDRVFTWKVETHNSPSAIDPYGGAITGILGNNRDPLGTGVGGGKLLFNTDVLCFAPENYDKKLLKKQLHPNIVKYGVVKGIKDGGNKSGIPTVNGAVIYDDRYAGKPLVFCGTGGIMDSYYGNKKSWEKIIENNDIIYMLGGRVGKDGIHGATFSSLQLDELSPTSAVQIGSPITQKLVSDFLGVATKKGLVSASTDNGAGGLSSSVGELATITNGAKVYLDRVPLKYQGLKPWEIFVSESQERMTLAVNPKNRLKIEKLAKDYSVELTDIGVFTNSEYLEVFYKENTVAKLNLEFIHNGVPKKHLLAEYQTPILKEPNLENSVFDYLEIVKTLLKSDNIKSREDIIRQYDHEVKGKTILKPLMGESRKAPQDAAVIRLDFKSKKAVAVSNGINPKYGDIDAYQMSAGAFDEAIRSIISIGGKFPTKDRFWSVNDNFCVPNSVFDENSNKDGKFKLAKLVKMNQALYDMGTFYNIPFTSGKDSMKNDFYGDNIKISIPPTILYSATALIDNFEDVITSDFKNSGDLIYQLGETYNELGASEFYKSLGHLGKNVPKVRFKKAKELYENIIESNENKLIESSHDISDGGMIIALIESMFGNGKIGCNINIVGLGEQPQRAARTINNLSRIAKLFAESHSRFIVSVKESNKGAFEEIFGKRAFYLGKVNNSGILKVFDDENLVMEASRVELLKSWELQ